MSIPVIKTAVPKRRYQLGEFMITVLGEVESGDGIEYRYILGVSREGEPQPSLCVSAERNTGGEGGAYALRVSMPDGSQVLGQGDRWQDVGVFTDEALDIVSTILSLQDEEAHRLL